MQDGWISLWRKFRQHEFWRKKRIFSKAEAWLDILMEVRWEDESENVLLGWKTYDCGYGESLNAILTWAKRWKWSESKVRRFFDYLKSCSMIEVKSDTKTTHLKVCNFEHYQKTRRTNEEQTKNKRRQNNKGNKVNKLITYKKEREGAKRFAPPTPIEVGEYSDSIGFDLDGSTFCDFYEARGWMLGKNKMKSWKAAIRTWKSRQNADKGTGVSMADWLKGQTDG